MSPIRRENTSLPMRPGSLRYPWCDEECEPYDETQQNDLKSQYGVVADAMAFVGIQNDRADRPGAGQ